MQKTVLGPGFGEVDSDEIDHARFSFGVATDHPDHKRVVLSGLAADGETVGEQTRETLELVERTLADVGGSMDDLVTMRWFVDSSILSRETQTRLHEVRAEFFDPPHYPASTMVGAELLGDDVLVEIEAEAEVPNDEWKTTAIVGRDHEELTASEARELLLEDE
ncbi:RidA family protein [Halorussus halophilus]|uniref:RidA family protein n=1 Tax=Halorussus halophilus TaxID=2650975 RepID=UPI001787CB13|nr:RidA family protein [Halorussus halophilus]